MDFYISSLAARIPCTRLHRQVQDPRGRPVAAFAISSDGRLAAMATYPRDYRSVERSVNVLFKDGKALRTSNYHKAVQRQRRLAEQHNELEYNVEQYIRHSLEVDSIGNLVEEVAMSTPSLRAIIKDNNAEPGPEPRPVVPCAVVIYDTMYFNPVEEFIYGYKLNDAVYMNSPDATTPAMGVVEPSPHLSPNIANAFTGRCFFRPSKMSFVCNDSVLVLSSPEDGAKLFSMDTEYVELLCHFRPQLRDDVNMESLKVLSVNVVMDDLETQSSELPPVFTSPYVFCHACQHSVLKDVEECKDDALPYTIVIECILSLSSHPPLRMVLHSRWPRGDVTVSYVSQMYPYVDQLSAPVDHVVSVFRARLTDTEEFDVLNRVHTYWAMEPYMHDKTEFLIQSDKPIVSGYTKTLLASRVNNRDYLEEYQFIAMYTPDSQLYVMDPDCNVLGQTEVHNAEEGFFTIDVDRTGSMLALIGAESIFVYRLHVSRDEDGVLAVAFQLQMKFPHVVGVGRREEILSACLGRDLGNRWMYVSVARGSVDAVMYIVDVTPSKGKDPIKRTLNMNSVIFPCITDMVALENSILVMPRHQRFLVQLTQEHQDSTDDTYSRQFCHFPLLATNKEALMLNSTVENCPQPVREKFDILLMERDRQISTTMKTSDRLNIGRWLDALYQYNALCMYKGRGVIDGMDPHDYLLPPLRRARQQFPFGYDAKQFYDPLLGIEFTGSPALMRAQCYEWARDVITRSGFINPLYRMEVIYDEKLQMLDYVCAKICISQWDNPADILFSMRSNDFLRLQLCNFLKISQRLELPCDAQGMIPCEKTMIFKKVSDVMPQMIMDGVQIPVRQSRASLEREAFELIRQQLAPELMSIQSGKLKKIIRDRLYRLRKKLSILERYKQEHDLIDARPDLQLDEIARNDCRLPVFREPVDQREVLLSEFAMRVRIKVLTTFYKAHKDGGPDLDEFDSS
ncbi:l-threonine synthase, putative [Babesia ovata]|uniref:L-threonine synthase, putative n=1 Tax=Babesia ovata TaxID=189622 RepID=A0A2H6KCC1_9APIC|nr:l-threonine synthase, putative [Babesia ovata]GBE60650.1 l-threonine synthase, putative [Babesia ovata]